MNWGGVTIHNQRRNRSGGPTRIDLCAAALWRLGEATCGDIAREGRVAINSAVHAVQRLRKRGFLRREQWGGVWVYSLTKAGAEYARNENDRLEASCSA